MNTMSALWLEDGELSLRNISMPEPQPGEALVRVRMAGICATDLELVKGYYPFTGVLGHEFVGEVITSERSDLIGKRVVGEINAVCWQCETCRRGDHTHCENRTVLGIVKRNGAFAQYLILPDENLLPVPDEIPDEVAVFTEPLAAALEIQEQMEIQPTERVLVVGAGRLGQMIAWTLAATGCELQVAARHPSQRAALESKDIVWIDPEKVPEAVFDIAVEATGSASGFVTARHAVRPRGTIVMKSTYKGDLAINFSSIVVDEITIVGSRCGPFDKSLMWMKNNHFDPLPLIHGRFGLKDGLRAMGRAAQPGVMKILLDAMN